MWKLRHALSQGTLHDPERRVISISRIYYGGLLIFLLILSSVAYSADPNTVIQVAESPDEVAFKNMLIKNSPWNVEWDNTTYLSSGTHEITFALEKKSGALVGRFLGSSRNPSGPLKDIVLKKNCISLTLSTGSRYDYCLVGDKTLKGPYNGTSSRGNDFEGVACRQTGCTLEALNVRIGLGVIEGA